MSVKNMLNKLLFVLRELWIVVSSIITTIIMMLVYFIFVVPIGLFMRFIGKDLLLQKLDKNTPSYWIERNQSLGSMKDQF